MNITTIIFDMDGVLFDTERLTMDAWSTVASRRGLKGIEEIYTQCVGRNAADTERILLDFYGDIDIDEFYEEFRTEIYAMLERDGMPIKPYAAECLSALKESGYRLALASSTRTQTVERQLKDAGFYDYFEQIVCGDQIPAGKPAPDIYLEACRRMGVEPSLAAAVEDSYNGVRSAAAAGLTVIMVPDLVSPDEEIRGLADYVAADLSGVMELFGKQPKG